MSESRSIIRWEAPRDSKTKGRWDRVADELRARPGEWAIVELLEKNNNASRLVSSIRRGVTTSFAPAGTFEAAQRTRDDGGFAIYARYVGKAGA